MDKEAVAHLIKCFREVFFDASDTSSTKPSKRLTGSALAKVMLLRTEDLVFFCISHNGADYHVLKKLAMSAGEEDGPVIFRLVSFPFLEHGCVRADFKSFGTVPDFIEAL